MLLFKSLLGGYWKYLAIVGIASFAYWYVWDTGRDFERAKWEAAMIEEQARGIERLENAYAYGALLADELHAAGLQRGDILRRLQNAARNSPNAGAACLDADGVLRLNTFRGDDAAGGTSP